MLLQTCIKRLVRQRNISRHCNATSLDQYRRVDSPRPCGPGQARCSRPTSPPAPSKCPVASLNSTTSQTHVPTVVLTGTSRAFTCHPAAASGAGFKPSASERSRIALTGTSRRSTAHLRSGGSWCAERYRCRRQIEVLSQVADAREAGQSRRPGNVSETGVQRTPDDRRDATWMARPALSVRFGASPLRRVAQVESRPGDRPAAHDAWHGQCRRSVRCRAAGLGRVSNGKARGFRDRERRTRRPSTWGSLGPRPASACRGAGRAAVAGG